MSAVSSLAYIQQCLTRYGMTTYLTFGNIGLFLNIAFFSQPTHRRTPSSLYILAMSFCALIGLNISVIPIIYGLDHPDPLTTFSLFCQLQRYLRHTFNQMMRTFFVLTCTDRYAISSHYVRIRSFSRYKIAMVVIPCVIIFWLIVGFLATMPGSLVYRTCSTNNGLYAILNSTYFPIVVGIIPLICMMTFGILLYKNLKRMRGRVQPTTMINPPANQHLRKRDRDMLRMLLIEGICHIITLIPITIMLIYSSITRTATKGNEQRQIESFVTYMTNSFVYYMNNCFSFWIYICASRSFRLEFKKLIIKFYGFITGKQVRMLDDNSRTDN